MSQNKELWREKVALFRSRFVAREDVFSTRKEYVEKSLNPETGEMEDNLKKIIMPMCSNYGNKDLCLITKTQKKNQCQDCSNKHYQVLTDEWVLKHITGHNELIMYMLRNEGIRFGCVDFDKGNTFEDAKLVRDISRKMGLECYIARSTSKGYHLYWFFSDYIMAHEFNSFIRYIFETLGFYDRWHQNPLLGLPEVFPKQISYNNAALGNGIKVPMMEDRMREGRNCWVDDQAIPIPFEKQWEYLETTILNTPEVFKKALVDSGVEIIEAPASRNRNQAKRAEEIKRGIDAHGNPVTHMQSGSFQGVIEGCAAMREYWSKGPDGVYLWDKSNPKGLFNAARVASMNIAMSTTDGEKIILERWPTKETERQLESAKLKGYLPTTCRWMQDNNVCNRKKHPKFGDHCLKKIPPLESFNGELISNEQGLPEEFWPEPSPYRYASDKHLSPEDVIERLTLVFNAIKNKNKNFEIKIDPNTGHPEITADFITTSPEERLESLFMRLVHFSKDEMAKIDGAIIANKWMTKTQIKEMKKRCGAVVNEEKDKKFKDEHPDSFTLNGVNYYTHNNAYYKWVRDGKGVRVDSQLTNFIIKIEEEVITLKLHESEDLTKDTLIEDRQSKGFILVNDQKYRFHCPSIELSGSSDAFFKMLTKTTGSACMYERKDYDAIRNCVHHCNKDNIVIKKQIQQIGQHLYGGNSLYIMPSVIVSKDEIRQNTDFMINMADEASRKLDFKIISEEQFKEVCQSIVFDYFKCNKEIGTMTLFAHAVASTIVPQISRAVSFTKAPTLWLSGSFGGGKTFILENAQWFFGEFETIMNARGSANARINAAYNFRHAMLGIDDYKKSTQRDQGADFISFIQNAYDRNGRTALQRNGVMRPTTDRVRGLVTVTGEDYFETESSALSRIILVDTEWKEDREAGARVLSKRKLYAGFLPYFIKFIFNISTEEIAALWKEYYDYFYIPVKGKFDKEGASRVCENITVNMVAFRIAMDAMVAHGAIPEPKREELCRQHQINLEVCRMNIFKSVSAAKGSQVFLDHLVELLQNPGRYFIQDLPSATYADTSRATAIGIYKATHPNVVFIYPPTAIKEIGNMVRGNGNSMQGAQHISRQLFEDGFMEPSLIKGKSRYTTQISGVNGVRTRVWPIKMEALRDLQHEEPKAKNGSTAGLKNYAVHTKNVDDNEEEESYF